VEFRSAAQQRCYETILPWIAEIYGEFAIPRDDAPVVDVYYGTSRTSIVVLPWGEDDAVITNIAWLVTRVEVTSELMQFLLQENLNVRFGAFGVDEEGDICFRHSVAGSACTKDVFRASTRAVVMAADRYDDQIMVRWGGARAIDRSF
jgi:hypothetical protein